jgi:hypothetical protein
MRGQESSGDNGGMMPRKKGRAFGCDPKARQTSNAKGGRRWLYRQFTKSDRYRQ